MLYYLPPAFERTLNLYEGLDEDSEPVYYRGRGDFPKVYSCDGSLSVGDRETAHTGNTSEM